MNGNSSKAELPNCPALYSRAVGELAPISLSALPEPSPQTTLLNGRLPEGFPTILYGDGGQGKSYLALALATGIASGKGLGGISLPKGVSLYLDWELSLNEQLRRAYRVARGFGLSEPPRDLLYLEPPRSLPHVAGQLKDLIEKNNVSFIVVDSFGPACGTNPEAADEMIRFFAVIRSLHVTTLLLDHQSKLQEGQSSTKKTPFGSAYKFNLARSVLHLERVGTASGELKVFLRHTKSNLGPLCDDLALRFNFRDNSLQITEADMKSDSDFQNHLTIEEKILQAIERDGEATAEVLGQRTGIPAKTISNTLPKLKKAGKVVETGKDRRKLIWGLASNRPKSNPYRAGELGDSASDLYDSETTTNSNPSHHNGNNADTLGIINEPDYPCGG